MKAPTGKLYTSNVTGLKKVDFEAEILLITRAGQEIPNVKVVRELSPSPDLFQTFLNQWKNKNPAEWWHLYEQRFQHELISNEKKRALREVYKKLLNGNDVVLVCFCADHRYCHRRLVGEFFKPYGVEAKEINPLDIEQLTLF
jgi:uncharacterized protein YeaO (DUF488 family)